MKYKDGTEVHLGDRVETRSGDKGTVIASIDADEYGPEAKKEDWAYLGDGIVVRTDRGAFVRFESSDSTDLLWKV
jgi:hypothetical protein